MNAGTIEDVSTRGGDGALRRCIGDPNAFLADIWGTRAAVYTAADRPAGFADLLTFDDVDRLLTTTSLRAPAFRVVKAGEKIAESAYTRSGTTGSKPVAGMADPARIAELFRDGATIVLQGLHRYHEPVSRLCRDLELDLGHPCQVNAYITPPGAQGLAVHADPHDVFTLQAFGRKRWEIHTAPREPERPPLDTLVEPGDCIYMPAGTSHAASTQDELSGHLTIGVHVTPWREVVAEAVRSALEEDPSLDEGVPAGWHRDPEAFARELAARMRSAAGAAAGSDAEAFAQRRRERFLSRRPPALRGVLAAGQTLDSLDDATQLRRRPGSVCELRAGVDGLTVLLGDRRLEMPARLEPAMRRIAATDHLTPGDLVAELPDARSRAVLARRLVREGLLLPGEATTTTPGSGR
ncbi:MAG: cupin domain-containing protein [Actinomycetota bacterium]